MRRLRITAKPIADDPSAELRRLSFVRRDLYGHSPVEFDPDNPAHQSRRDGDGPAYFEFSTDFEGDVERVLKEYDHELHVTVSHASGPAGEPCVRCGTVSGITPLPVCPNCHLREISPCPYCDEDVSRHEYVPVAGDVFRCPRCEKTVRLRFNEPLLLPDGAYNEPVVVVDEAIQEPA